MNRLPTAKATADSPKAFGAGGKGIRTPDFQLAKLALYQLSYAPYREFRISIADFRLQGNKSRMPDVAQASRHPARVVSLVCLIVKRVPPSTPLTRP